MQIVQFSGDTLAFLETVPTQAPEQGFVWVYLDRSELPGSLPELQQLARNLGGSGLLDLHWQDLGYSAHPSNYDFTSVYDLLIFRRLSTPLELEAEAANVDGHDEPVRVFPPNLSAFSRIRTQAVGFAVFDQLLISVHPGGCIWANQFIERMLADAQISVDAAGARSRVPLDPTDLTLRLVNAMVDGYLELRKELTTQLEHWQMALLTQDNRFDDWTSLMLARSQLHMLQDLCEEQLDAMQEWLDSLREQPLPTADAAKPHPSVTHVQREQLVARTRDVIEHIERVMQHVHRLEQSAETVVQIHFNVQSNRTNDIMRVLTTLTAIFLPLNLIAGVFGMNFKDMPPLDWPHGFWLTVLAMVLITVLLSIWFWRKRYLNDVK